MGGSNEQTEPKSQPDESQSLNEEFNSVTQQLIEAMSSRKINDKENFITVAASDTNQSSLVLYSDGTWVLRSENEGTLIERTIDQAGRITGESLLPDYLTLKFLSQFFRYLNEINPGLCNRFLDNKSSIRAREAIYIAEIIPLKELVIKKHKEELMKGLVLDVTTALNNAIVSPQTTSKF